MAATFQRYGETWKAEADELTVELTAISLGGSWKGKAGQVCGLGLFEHMMNARRLLWPGRYRHRWTDLIYKAIIKNIVTILMGPGSSQKTSHAAEFALIDYWAHPHDTLILISTTTTDKLDLAIYGEVKMLFEEGKERYEWLAGHVLESKRAITTDDIETKEVRDIRKGFIGRACYVGKQYVGLGVYAGVKQKRIRFIADELQFMQSTFFDCLPNMFQSAGLDASGDPDVKIIGSGNPKHDPYDQLSMAAEPELGWSSVGDVTKTSTWATKFHRGECVNLIGLDSPNMDVAPGEKPPFPRLISRNTIAVVEKRWGKNSMQFYSQCVGKMMMNMVGNRVITKDLCEQHRAFETAVWRGSALTRIGFLDPAWGGASSDRCVWGWLEFGTELEGREVIRFGEYLLVPFAPKSAVPPDDQIAAFVKQQAKLNGIEPRDIFYDSTGRGTTGAAFARVFGMEVPVPVAFGDRCSTRPVRHDLFVEEPDGTKRLKRCDEEYGKFVTELWFAARNVIECDQMRELPEEVAKEGYMREYTLVKGNKYDVEPKEDTRDRMGCSPDLFDAYAVGIEGARQRGFSIGRLGYDLPAVKGQEDWFEKEAREYRETIKNKLLKHR